MEAIDKMPHYFFNKYVEAIDLRIDKFSYFVLR